MTHSQKIEQRVCVLVGASRGREVDEAWGNAGDRPRNLSLGVSRRGWDAHAQVKGWPEEAHSRRLCGWEGRACEDSHR